MMAGRVSDRRIHDFRPFGLYSYKWQLCTSGTTKAAPSWSRTSHQTQLQEIHCMKASHSSGLKREGERKSLQPAVSSLLFISKYKGRMAVFLSPPAFVAVATECSNITTHAAGHFGAA